MFQILIIYEKKSLKFHDADTNNQGHQQVLR